MATDTDHPAPSPTAGTDSLSIEHTDEQVLIAGAIEVHIAGERTTVRVATAADDLRLAEQSAIVERVEQAVAEALAGEQP